MAQAQIYVIQGSPVALVEQHGSTVARPRTSGAADFERRKVQTWHRSREIAGESANGR